MMVKLPQVRPPESSMIGNHRIFIGLPKRYLAKDEVLGELYVIYMYGNMEYNTQHVEPDRSITFSTFVKPLQVTTVEVFKLDMNKYPIGWLNVKLDDKVAFVSSWKSIVMSRDERNYNKELTTGNSLYFLIN
ncbi:F-box protein, partial [Trifolium medium]|nr:F-box protein [Trifolium medium]